VRKTMEKAFWDGISDSVQQEKYDHVVVLMKEVRNELCEMSPKTRKQDILEVIDLDILSHGSLFQGQKHDTIGPGAFTKIYMKQGTQIFGTRCT
ncbi:T-complex protein 11, partial [Tanacetum coccineum]